MSYVNTKTMNYASFVSNACRTICLSQTQRCHSFAMHRLLSAFLPLFTKYTVLCPLAGKINFYRCSIHHLDLSTLQFLGVNSHPVSKFYYVGLTHTVETLICFRFITSQICFFFRHLCWKIYNQGIEWRLIFYLTMYEMLASPINARLEFSIITYPNTSKYTQGELVHTRKFR